MLMLINNNNLKFSLASIAKCHTLHSFAYPIDYNNY